MNYRFFAPLLILVLILACGDSHKEELGEQEQVVSTGEVTFLSPIKIDSTSFDNGSEHFLNRIASLDSEVYQKNRIYLYNREGLIVASVDTLGNFVKKITQRGDGPGELIVARSAKAWQNSKGDLYVLTNANAYSLYVFDTNGNYRYVIRLYQELKDQYHSVSSSFHISEKVDGRFKLTLGINTNSSSPYKKDFYTRQPSLAQFIIDDNQERVISKNTYWPYTDIPEVKSALEAGKLCWSGSEARFDIQDDNIYLTYPFLRKVYKLNQRFELEATYELQTLAGYKGGYCRDLAAKAPENTYERTYRQYHTYLSNLHIRDIQVMDELIMLQFVVPMEESKFLPNFPTAAQARDIGAYQGFFQPRDMYWVIFNTDTGQEKVVRLSDEHRQGVFLDKNRLLVEKVLDDVEDRYLVKYRLDHPISD